MKRILSLTLSTAAVLALMAPIAASAQNATPTPKYKKGGGGPPQSGGGGPATQPQFVHPAGAAPSHTPTVSHTPYQNVSHTQKFTAQPTPAPQGTGKPLYHKNVNNNPNTVNPGPGTTPKSTYTKGAGYKKPPIAGNTPAPGGGTQASHVNLVNKNIHIKQNNTNWAGPKHGGGGGGGGGAHQFTQANNYGGHWVAWDAHQDWNRREEHDWDGHHWRWFNGGWLNIDNGFWPEGYYNYTSGPNKIYDAQAELANMGYYNGTVDGVPGPMTRQAISDFQGDNGLPVDGHLNPPTQDALGLQ